MRRHPVTEQTLAIAMITIRALATLDTEVCTVGLAVGEGCSSYSSFDPFRHVKLTEYVPIPFNTWKASYKLLL